MTDPDVASRRIAAESLGANDPTGWFERLYAAAESGDAAVPWDRRAPHRLLVEWSEARGLAGGGRRALVVGCGFGDDAEYVASLGFDTVAFDISETAVRAALARWPGTKVRYRAADLLDLPGEWRGAFDLVVESLTVQSLPVGLRSAAIASVTSTVAPGGTLLVIAAARDETDKAYEGPPWPLTREDLEEFIGDLRPTRVEDLRAEGSHRWRAEFTRGPARLG